ncbi:MAG TPA: hypothetical protein VFO69_00700 [Allosphingosinicella sp.]|nr:hypothetical protein [Allosphingosinicella sp.]
MTDLDLDRLGDLWRQRPTAAEMESLRRTAEAVRRKARWGQFVDVAAAVIVATIVVILVLTNPRTDTMLVGTAAILVMLAGQTRSRRLRAEELRGLTGSSEEMLEQSIVRAQATLKRTRFQLIGIVPSFLLGLGIAALVDRSSGQLYARIVSDPSLGLWITAGAILLVATVAVAFTRSLRASRHELEHLRALRDAFRAESAQV